MRQISDQIFVVLLRKLKIIFVYIGITSAIFHLGVDAAVAENPSIQNQSTLNPSEMCTDAFISNRAGSKLTLTNAVSMALTNSPDALISEARVEEAKAGLKMARAPFFPAFSFYTEYLKADAPSSYLFKAIDQRELPQLIDFNDPGIIRNHETGIKTQFSIFNGGKTLLNKKMAEKGMVAAHYQQQDIKNSITASVITAFYNGLAAREYIEIANQSVKTVEEQLRIITVKYNNGGVLKSDVLSLEVRLSQAKEDVVKSMNRYKTALAFLNMVLGVDPNSCYVLEDTGFLNIDIPQKYEEGLSVAMKKRPDLKIAMTNVSQGEMAVNARKGDFLPKVFLQGKYYFDDSDFKYNRHDKNWLVGVLLNWDVFTGFSTDASVRKAQAAYEAALSENKKARLSAQMDVKVAYLNLTAAKARLQVTERSVGMANETLSLVKKQLEGGTSTVSRYLDAEVVLNQAKINVVSARYDKEKSLAEIGRSLGILYQK